MAKIINFLITKEKCYINYKLVKQFKSKYFEKKSQP